MEAPPHDPSPVRRPYRAAQSRLWLSQRCQLPLADRTTAEAKAKELDALMQQLADSGRFGRAASRLIGRRPHRVTYQECKACDSLFVRSRRTEPHWADSVCHSLNQKLACSRRRLLALWEVTEGQGNWNSRATQARSSRAKRLQSVVPSTRRPKQARGLDFARSYARP